VGQYHHIVEEQHLNLKYELVNGGDGTVLAKADAAKLQQVLINLLSNAVTFTHKGGITLRLEPHANYVRIFVIDTGEGIPV
jgi:signal transduction histidine kinase